jgi:hypothetical protein
MYYESEDFHIQMLQVVDDLYDKPISVSGPFLVFSLKEWLVMKRNGYGIAQWTNKEIKNRDKETGFIGTKNGVDCYVLKLLGT